MLLGCRNRIDDSSLVFEETYKYDDQSPFGVHALKSMIEQIFQSTDIKPVQEETYFEYMQDLSAYFLISSNYLATQNTVDELRTYVRRGNVAFIAAASFSEEFQQVFKISVQKNWLYSVSNSSLYDEAYLYARDDIKYGYYYYPFHSYFIYDEANNKNIQVAGYSEEGMPNWLVIREGKGKLIVHCEPRAFSNYFLLSGKNYRYLNAVLQEVHGREMVIYWDDYYQDNGASASKNEQTSSIFDELTKDRSLAWATWLFILLLLIFVVVESRRKRAIIPIIKSNTNSGIEFTETIAMLYLQQKDHKGMAQKMILYFNEYIRSKYNVNPIDVNAEWLSKKSDVPVSDIRALHTLINEINGQAVVTDKQLFNLNQLIFSFYK
jgi:hypothetical protein